MVTALDVMYAGTLAIGWPYVAARLLGSAEYRFGLSERLGRSPKLPASGRPVWIHAASIGEVQASVPLVRRLGEIRGTPVLSTMTATGRKVAHQTFPNHAVFLFPLDFSFCVERALDRIRPSAIVLVEWEIWPNFLRAARERRIPVAVVNGRVTGRSFERYRRAGAVLRRAFESVSFWAVQSLEYSERCRGLGIPADRIHVTGNMKFDRARGRGATEGAAESRGRELGIPSGHPVLVAGSTHSPEEELIGRAYLELRAQFPELWLFVVPRYPARADEVFSLLGSLGLCPRLWSEWKSIGGESGRQPSVERVGSAKLAGGERSRVVVVDAVGELSRLYEAASICFVGGSFTARGGQNFLEPASVGKPVVVGPSVENFREAAELLLERDAMRVARSGEELRAIVKDWLDNPDRGVEMGRRAAKAVGEARGATERNLRLLESLWNGSHGVPR